MIALIIAENEEVVSKIQTALESRGYSTVLYRWLLKALDNVVEISPDVTIISVFDYPRHWKTLVQYEKSGICRKIPKVILYKSGEMSEEEKEKARALGVAGIFNSLDNEGFLQLEKLLESGCEEGTESASDDDLPSVEGLLGKEFVEKNSGGVFSVEAFLNSLVIPSVDSIFGDDEISEAAQSNGDSSNTEPAHSASATAITTPDSASNTEDVRLPSVDELYTSMGECSFIMPDADFPTVDTLFNFADDEPSDFVTTRTSDMAESMVAEKTDFPVSTPHIPTVDDILAALERIPLPEAEKTTACSDEVIPSVDSIFESEDFASSSSEQSPLPTVDSVFCELPKETSDCSAFIPSVDLFISDVADEEPERTLPATSSEPEREAAEELPEAPISEAPAEELSSVPSVDSLFDNETLGIELPTVTSLISSEDDESLTPSADLIHVEKKKCEPDLAFPASPHYGAV